MTVESDLWDTLQARLTKQERLLLDRPISKEELRHALKTMAKGKVSGDDGLPIEFFITCWHDLEANVVKLYNDILTGGLVDLREHFAIEALEILEKEDLDVAVLLIDLEKAYDRVNWTFVMTTLRVMGFGDAFCRWVKVLYAFSTAVVQVNGVSSEEFQLSCSIRQGCPLAPLLFVLQLDTLLSAIRANPGIQGLQLQGGGECRVKALADDLFALSMNTSSSLEALRICLHQYVELSEAAINWNKSSFFLPEEYQFQAQWGMHRVPMGEAQRFLGVMIALRDSISSQEVILQERVVAQIKSWGRAPHLSLVGRAMVITMSAFSLLWFVLRTIKLSDSTLKAIRAAGRRFLWKPDAKENQGYIAKVAWETVCAPREDGGLAITEPGSQNLTLLANWLVKVAEAQEPPDWCLMAGHILMNEWGMSRPSDVWLALMTDSFLNKRFKSPFWNSVLQAWKQVKPNYRTQPNSKEEVKAQPLFENSLIRGVATIGNSWDELRNCWCTPEYLKEKLGCLPSQAERLELLIQAVPKEWKQLLGPAAVNPPGTWFRGTRGEEKDKFYSSSNWDAEQNGKCSLEVFTRANASSTILGLAGTVTRRGLSGLQEVRIRTDTRLGRQRRTIHSIVAGGVPIRELRIDPKMWGWEIGEEVVKDLSKLNLAMAGRKRVRLKRTCHEEEEDDDEKGDEEDTREEHNKQEDSKGEDNIGEDNEGDYNSEEADEEKPMRMKNGTAKHRRISREQVEKEEEEEEEERKRKRKRKRRGEEEEARRRGRGGQGGRRRGRRGGGEEKRRGIEENRREEGKRRRGEKRREEERRGGGDGDEEK
ncbi:hypothetical protein CBR_g32463 [Chara braunii]|uniref:Reverse transcriptase domain-containing protein n=1 Tax=Chara braunii TaxID=69332 RepID=A0A388LGX0_CHABU|nr:hypothetical protein CBR_g32463 [Chara braunii]|eukprot:GBG81473.1 hypothetical protein CBR_g32463 [Chara braunii]